MKFENSVMINQPVQQVFEYVTDFTNNAAWQTGILEMEITSEEPFGRGTTYRCVNRFMGTSLETEGLVTEFEPDRRCRIRITSGIVTGTSSREPAARTLVARCGNDSSSIIRPTASPKPIPSR